MNQTNNRINYSRSNETMSQAFIHSCLGKLLLLAGILIVLLIVAYFTAPNEKEMRDEINDDITALSDTSLQALALLSGDEESQILADDSEQDEETAVIFGKVKDSTNEGAVNGDNNVGGVAGSISVENELDPEGNLDLSKARLTRNRLSMRAVIRHCVSRGAVSANAAGGSADAWKGVFRSRLNQWRKLS